MNTFENILFIEKVTGGLPKAIRNYKSGRTHQCYGDGLTRCGLKVKGNPNYEMVISKVNCRNCIHPGHDNLGGFFSDYYYAFDMYKE